jgi:hypothetical protein
MLKTRISVAFCSVAALSCFSSTACSGGGGKANPTLIGTSGTIILVARSSTGRPPDVSDGSGSMLVVTSPTQ